MHNMVYLIGRIASELENKEEQVFNVAVQRTLNEEGIYETDIIPVLIKGTISTTTYKYCKKGDLVGVKGQLYTIDNKLIVMVEKLSFLSSNKEILDKEN